MGFFSSLFGGKSKEERELEAIFKKTLILLNDDKAQMACVPEFLLDMYDTTPMNRVPGGIGEFGRDPRNPIPCNGPLGEITYLSKLIIPLKNSNSVRITFHRTGSLKANGKDVDRYEIISYDGYLYDVLYMDMYHTNKSRLCPKGYKIESQCSGIRGTNHTNETFPQNQYQCVRECSNGLLGLPAFDTQLKNMDITQAAKTIPLCRKLGAGALNWWDEE